MWMTEKLQKSEDDMEDPKTVVKKEPRKSLIVLFVMSIISIVLGAIITFASSGNQNGMGGGAGYVMIIGGIIAMAIYIYGRKTGRP
ncbi:hypothetical protein GCM10007418_21180 [Halopseudomonas salina]|uniref:Uncharacterized protein n=2 Tax=Halopseudomonas salina TaxID=1323744 RepID=A0ABQ1PRG0_9GAMM|nr:hypothetical protein GCM10007418_21180 [Halopseudomonas salina]